MNKNKKQIVPIKFGIGQKDCNLCKNKSLNLLYSLKLYDVVQCCRCGLRFRTKRPSIIEAKALYENQHYLNSNLFVNWKSNYSEDAIEVNIFKEGLLALDTIHSTSLSDNKKRKILDIGCARGVFLDLARRYSWDAIGIDLSSQSAEFARTNFGLSVRVGTLEEAGFPDQFFDAVTMWDVIEHLEDPMRTLKEIRRILKPRGALLIMTPNSDSLINFIGRVLYFISLGFFIKPIELLYDLHHNYYFSERTLGVALSKTGFGDMFCTKRYPAYVERWQTTKIPYFLKVGANVLDYISKLFNLDYRIVIGVRK